MKRYLKTFFVCLPVFLCVFISMGQGSIPGIGEGMPEVKPQISYEGLYYDLISFEDKTVELIYNIEYQNLQTVDIPETIKVADFEYRVSGIADKAFSTCRNLRWISIPNSVEYIGELAFYYCDSLKSISFPSAVDTLRMGVCLGCSSLESIEWPENLKCIEDMVFNFCDSISAIEIPNGVTILGVPFWFCPNLKTFTLPADALFKSKSNPFRNCDSLSEFIIDPQNPWYSTDNGMLFNKDKTYLYSYPTASGHVEIPSGVKEIAAYGFTDCRKITSVTLPSSMEKLGEMIFSNCHSLKKIYSMAVNPPVLGEDGLGFLDAEQGVISMICDVYVPDGSVERYEEAGWEKVHPLSELAGVEELPISEDKVSTVYTIDGKMVMKTEDETLLQSLPKGLYIINGKKVAIGCR